MKRAISLFIFIALLSACSKEEKDFLLWQVSRGSGEAFSVNVSDSGFYACGSLDGSAYFILYDNDRKQLLDLKTGLNGMFTSAWFDRSSYILAGRENRRMFLQRYNPDGTIAWQRTLDGSYNIDQADLFYLGNNTLLAVGSADADSLSAGDNGILFLKFDTAGNIISRKDITGTGYVSARADRDAQGNIFLALTRQSAGSRSRSAAAKYNSDFNLLWETDLFNNPAISSSSLSVKKTGDRILIAGRTELPSGSGTVLNSFIVSLDNNGNLSSGWSKKYPEAGNEGPSLAPDKNNDIVMLNRRCMVLTRIGANDGLVSPLSRTFDVCSAESTDVFGNDAKVMNDGNILLAGSVGGKFFVGIRTPL
ncbi:MAG TPA: hypothetical protein VK155_20305 [Bacteroidales bacterium]|nr:hypothetical protein [Bacteroidales bacterium]